MFEVNNGTAKIDGIKGKYDGVVTNPSERYGRNSVQNFYSYLQEPIAKDNNATPPILDFSGTEEANKENIEQMEKYTQANDAYLNSLPPLEFEYRYMPNIHKKGEIDKEALLGAAYEQLGQRDEVAVEDLEKTFAPTEDYTSKPMDLNKDGKVDKKEYSTSILAADLLSKPAGTDIDGVDGTINNQGMNKLQELTKKTNAQEAAALYTALYNQYNLGDNNNKL